MTPRFYSLVDFIAVAIDVFEGKNRKKVFSELKTFSTKQVYFSDLFEKIKSELKLSDSEMTFISQSLIKVENILAHLKSIPLYTDISKDTGDNLFFTQFTVPFLKQSCSLASEYTGGFFFSTLEQFLFTGETCNNLKDIISILKHELSSELHHIDKSSSSEFKLMLSKLDSRSFPSRNSINKYINDLHRNVLIIENEDKANSVSLKIHTIFWSAKVAFAFAKLMKENPPERNSTAPEIKLAFLSFNKEYTLNPNISSENDSYINNANFIICKNHFLDSINQEDPVSFLKKNGTRALWQYKNGIFISYAIREQLVWDINKGRFTELGINQFIKNYIPELCKRQSGRDGVDIAVILIGMKVLLSKNITNNSLEPLINFLIDNLEKHTLLSYIASTPFGSYIPSNLTASEINVALAIRSFNESVRIGIINIKLCNPLSPLNEILNAYFEKGTLTKRQAERKPIKTEKATIYDALKNINYYILAFGLQEEVKFNSVGNVIVASSKCGDGINNYLSLIDSEKKTILKLISPDEFSLDLKNLIPS